LDYDHHQQLFLKAFKSLLNYLKTKTKNKKSDKDVMLLLEGENSKQKLSRSDSSSSSGGSSSRQRHSTCNRPLAERHLKGYEAAVEAVASCCESQ